MNRKKVIVASLIVIVIVAVIFGGFVYSYINKLNAFNQTKSYFQSLGYNIYILTLSTPAIRILSRIVDVASFISIARQNNATFIDVVGYHFYLFTAPTTYEYTPSNSIWWIWG
jgi:CBS domain containing-hemolysin-like protein